MTPKSYDIVSDVAKIKLPNPRTAIAVWILLPSNAKKHCSWYGENANT